MPPQAYLVHPRYQQASPYPPMNYSKGSMTQQVKYIISKKRKARKNQSECPLFWIRIFFKRVTYN